ncbi:MAG: hypothetical protein ACF8MJ_04450 [Phycisphaerales bacterium JB050]
MPDETATQFPERDDEITLDEDFEIPELWELDWVGAQVTRGLRADRLQAISQDGIPVFIAGRSRRIVRRVLAVVGAILVWMLGSMLAFVIGAIVAPQGPTTGSTAQDLIITFGMITSIFLAWVTGIYLTPVRPILLYELRDLHRPRLAIGPTRRVRLSNLVLLVIDEFAGPIGYLKRENRARIGWSAFDESGRLRFHVDRRGGPTIVLRVFSWLIPPLGVVVALMYLFSRPTRPLAIRSGDRRDQCGEIRPMTGLTGTTELCLDHDAHGSVDRRLGIAAMLVVTMYG